MGYAARFMDLASIVEAMTECQESETSFAFSIEQLYSNLLGMLKQHPNFDSWFAAELRKLANTPQGRQMMRDLRELDELWGYPLACRGTHFGEVMRQGEMDT
jgi:hypothetical protein